MSDHHPQTLRKRQSAHLSSTQQLITTPPTMISQSTCTTLPPPNNQQNTYINGHWFVDKYGRKILLRGVNLSSNMKTPSINDTTKDPCTISFVGKPFPVDEADIHFKRLRACGFNALRFLITWEAVEHFGPGIYDEVYIDSIIAILKRAHVFGFTCFMDPHQDVWSRACGGDGAPEWTLPLIGLDPSTLYASGAAVTESAWMQDPHCDGTTYPSMIWVTNYHKLACATMFTLFFAGHAFAPYLTFQDYTRGTHVISDNDQLPHFSSQDFLQFHFIQCMAYVHRRIVEANLTVIDDQNPDFAAADTVPVLPAVLGWDTMNEPNPGWIGCTDISVIMATQALRQGPTPTPLQTMCAGAGQTVSGVSKYRITRFGSIWQASKKLNENKECAWLSNRVSPQTLHSRGIQAASLMKCKVYVNQTPMLSDCTPIEMTQAHLRFPSGGCIWAAHGVYDALTQIPLNKAYFQSHPNWPCMKISMHVFTNVIWMDFVKRFTMHLRRVCPHTLMFLDPVVNEECPDFRPQELNSYVQQYSPIKTTRDDHGNDFHRDIVYAPHWYDGLTLVNKHYYPFNLDFLHVQRGLKNYFTGLRIGYNQVKLGMQAQLELLKTESSTHLGQVPVLIGEIGIPFDMDPVNQPCSALAIRAMDANLCALETNLLHATLWTYHPNNTDQGDHWNGEDLSIFRRGNPRPIPSLLRPVPQIVAGTLKLLQFDYQAHVLNIEIERFDPVYPAANENKSVARSEMSVKDWESVLSAAPMCNVSEIYIPWAHFKGRTVVTVSHGACAIDFDRQLLQWVHVIPKEANDQVLSRVTSHGKIPRNSVQRHSLQVCCAWDGSEDCDEWLPPARASSISVNSWEPLKTFTPKIDKQGGGIWRTIQEWIHHHLI